MEIIIVAAVIGIIPGMIAKGKGRSFLGWWAYGAALFIIALPHSILIKADKSFVESKSYEEGLKKCPYCAEFVKSEAVVCKHCGKDLS